MTEIAKRDAVEPEESEFFDSAEEIFAVNDVEIRPVFVAQWGKKVRLKMMTAMERDQFEASTVDNRGGKQKPNLANLRARLVSRCVVNAKGELLFTSGYVSRLGAEKSAAAIDFLFQECQKLNGFTKEDIEELVEDFEEGTASASSTA